MVITPSSSLKDCVSRFWQCRRSLGSRNRESPFGNSIRSTIGASTSWVRNVSAISSQSCHWVGDGQVSTSQYRVTTCHKLSLCRSRAAELMTNQETETGSTSSASDDYFVSYSDSVFMRRCLWYTYVHLPNKVFSVRQFEFCRILSELFLMQMYIRIP